MSKYLTILKKLARVKRASLFCRDVGDKEKKCFTRLPPSLIKAHFVTSIFAS